MSIRWLESCAREVNDVTVQFKKAPKVNQKYPTGGERLLWTDALY